MSEAGPSDEFEVLGTGETPAPARRGRKPGRKPRLRADVEPANVAPKRRGGRKPKLRADSDVFAEIDGFGNPFKIDLKPGWEAFWVSARDARRYRLRKWVQVNWGDERVIHYGGSEPGRKGSPIMHESLTLFLMRTSDAAAMRANDPFRRVHAQLKEEAIDKAENSMANGKRGRARFMNIELSP